MTRKLLKMLIKYFPIIQMVGMTVNNALCIFGVNSSAVYWIDFFIGNSFICTLLLLLISYELKYCEWYRWLIFANFVNIVICTADASFGLSFTGVQLFSITYIISILGIISAIYSHVSDVKHLIDEQ